MSGIVIAALPGGASALRPPDPPGFAGRGMSWAG